MKRPVAVAVAAFAGLILLQGCSLNPFRGSPPKAGAAPVAGEDTNASGEPARRARPKESMGLKRFDANDDSTLTRAELEQTLTADFKKDDANGDGQLDAAEARALNERLRAEPNTSPVFDWNADGRLVYAEFATQWRTLFDRADRNRDGIVDEGEIAGAGRDYKPRPLPQPTFSGKDGRPPGTP